MHISKIIPVTILVAAVTAAPVESQFQKRESGVCENVINTLRSVHGTAESAAADLGFAATEELNKRLSRFKTLIIDIDQACADVTELSSLM